MGDHPTTRSCSPPIDICSSIATIAIPPCNDTTTTLFVFYTTCCFHGRALGKLVPVYPGQSLLSSTDVFLCPAFFDLTPNPNRMEVSLDTEAIAAGLGNAPLTPFRSTLSPWYGHYRVICENDLSLSPRSICRSVLSKFPRGTAFKSAFEYEFSVGSISPQNSVFTPAFPLDIFSQHTLATSPKILEFATTVVSQGELMTPPVKITTINSEYSAGQLELPLTPLLGIESPDAAFTFKEIVRRTAAELSLSATFCSKVNFDSSSDSGTGEGCGNGDRYNFSLPGGPAGDGHALP